jgi:hypothetical protein
VSPAWEAFLRFFVDNKLIVFVLVAGIIAGGVYVSPFDWELGEMPSYSPSGKAAHHAMSRTKSAIR